MGRWVAGLKTDHLLNSRLRHQLRWEPRCGNPARSFVTILRGEPEPKTFHYIQCTQPLLDVLLRNVHE